MEYPIQTEGIPVVPDVEDINRDNTMNTINAYYKFSVDVKPNVTESDRYVSNILTTKVSPPLPDGSSPTVRWIQYKIPIQEITPANVEGGISDFRSIRFMRMFMTGFSDKVTVRLGALDLVRGEWRRYNASLETLDADPTDDNTGFDVVAVNLEENSNRTPIRYVMPPGVAREQLYNNNSVLNQNEQSLSLRVYKKEPSITPEGLNPGDSRAAFKNVDVDMRQYNKLKMFLHAEALPGDASPLEDDQMVGFVRFGNDFTENFYQVEIKLKVTPERAITAEQIWPVENEIDLKTALLTALKIKSFKAQVGDLDADGIFFKNEEELDQSALKAK